MASTVSADCGDRLGERLVGLDLLRAFAVLCVLFAHGGYFLFALWPVYDVYAFAGWLGTDLFFALAGFLLCAQLVVSPPRTIADIARWWVWRGWRVLPLFWAALVLHMLIAVFALAPPRAGDVLALASLTQNLAWPHPAFFGEAWNLPVLVLWFLLAPLLAYVVGTTRRPVAAYALGLLLWCIAGIALRAWWVAEGAESWDAEVRKIVVARLDACAYGGLAACLWVALRGRAEVLASIVAVIAWSLAALGFFLLPRDTSELAQIGLFVLCGVGGAAGALACLRVKRLPHVAAVLARWSYPLYLLNMPLLFAMAAVGLGQDSDPVSGAWRFLLWFGGACVLAAFAHRYVEAPLIAARSRRLAAPYGGSATASTNRRTATAGRDRTG